ncbi:glycosyltransferase [Brevundimonas sp. SL161]|uniref:glycosyltransferase n=1 Tax=Brevundimonas sp. SL161 TaxID=2804613 RepID=UPI003CFA6A47
MNIKTRARRALRALAPLSEPADTAQRELGDAARNRRDWKAAATHYTEYLRRAPRDFGIRVQLGHALKESGLFAEADDAYSRALKLRPRDADLLVNFGHLKKIRHQYAAAAELYVKAAEIERGGHGLAELGAIELTLHLTVAHRELRDRLTKTALADRLTGLRLLAHTGITWLGGDRFALSSGDPWLELKLESKADGPMGFLSLQVEPDDASWRPDARLYLDYANGYRDDLSLPLPDAVDGRVLVPLMNSGAIRSVRWDPDAKDNIIRFKGAAYVVNPDLDRGMADVRAQFSSDMVPDHALVAIRRSLLRNDFSAHDAIGVSARLMSLGKDGPEAYGAWLHRWIEPTKTDYARITEMTAAMPRKPSFSFVMPVYNPPADLLAECLDSLLDQTYADFEICIADDRSPNPEIRRLLEKYAARDSRIKLVLREHNGHISAASNSALALATGEFIVLVDHDDLIPDYCLFVVAHFINENPTAQILYSDEDKITVDGHRYDPYFKGDFDPFLMFGHNMVSHLGVYRRDLVEAIGGFRLGLEGSQDYDLVLRAIEHAGPDAIVHIPHVLYHWRAIPGSTAVSGDEKSYAVVAAQQAVNGHFERTGLPLRSVNGLAPGVNAVKPDRHYDTLVSVIIPTRDGVDDLRACIESVLAVDHSNTEILVVDNGSEDAATLAYLDRIQREEKGLVRVLVYPHAFNFSEINNFAVEHARGEILCFLNNDTEVIAKDWLARARGLIAVPGVGVVGARLLYPDGTLQHFGVVTGMAQHRVASTPHVGLPEQAGGYFGKARLLQQFSSVTAACMFVRADVFRGVGGFEPSLRVAYNDIDLCLKVRAAGHKVIADPQILLTHKESKSRGSDQTGAKAERLESEARTMRARWGEVLDRDPFWSLNHDLDHNDFRLAHPPRRPLPWQRPDDARDGDGTPSLFRPGRSYLSNLWAARRPSSDAAEMAPASQSGLGVIVRIGDASMAQVEETLRSLKHQQTAPRWTAFVTDVATPPERIADLKALATSSGALAVTGATLDKGLRAALAVGPCDQAMIVAAGDLLEPEAIERFVEAFEAGAEIAYCDVMKTGAEHDDIRTFVARSAFSHDGYLSHPYFNRGLAIDRKLIEQALDDAAPEPLWGITDLVLRCIERAASVAHIPAFLYRFQDVEPVVEETDSLSVIDAHLSRLKTGATAAPGLREGIFRIDYPDPGGRTLIIIPTKDGVELLRTCVESVRRTTTDVDIVIIDHQSTKPETLVYLESLKGQVMIEPYAGPFNFSDMNNLAAQRHASGYDYVVFMNNDIEAIEPGWLERMRSLAARPDVGVVGATLLYDDRTIQHAGVILGVGGCAAHGQTGADFERQGLRNPGYDYSLVSTRDYSAITAACMMMRTEVFLGVGGFDKDLAVGFNDTDLCLRVASLGYRILNDAHTVLYHHESATRSLTDDLKHPEDALRFLRRWKLLLAEGDPFYSPLLSLTTDFGLGDITEMYNPIRIRPVKPSIMELNRGRPAKAPAPLRYQAGKPAFEQELPPPPTKPKGRKQ